MHLCAASYRRRSHLAAEKCQTGQCLLCLSAFERHQPMLSNNEVTWTEGFEHIYLFTSTTTVLRPIALKMSIWGKGDAFFQDYQGEPVPEEKLLDFMVQGKINRGRHTGHPAGRHSIRTNQCPPPPSPIFHRLDALPAAQPTVSRHWRQLAHLDYVIGCNNSAS